MKWIPLFPRVLLGGTSLSVQAFQFAKDLDRAAEKSKWSRPPSMQEFELVDESAASGECRTTSDLLGSTAKEREDL